MIALAPLPMLAGAATAPPPLLARQDLTAEYDTLLADFEAAREAYYGKLRALYKGFDYDKATDAEREEFEKKYEAIQSEDPTASYRDKFQELAERAKGQEAAAKAWIQVVSLSSGGIPGLPGSPVSKALDALLRDHLQSKELAQLGWVLSAQNAGEKRFDEAMKTLREKSPHREVQASALRAMAAAKTGYDASAEDLKAVRPMWLELKEKYGDVKAQDEKTYGQIAEGTLFETDYLQIGCTPPDFDTVDETGAKFKLSDYRGKVVVLDFWGYW
jgi:hypothetical protein